MIPFNNMNEFREELCNVQDWNIIAEFVHRYLNAGIKCLELDLTDAASLESHAIGQLVKLHGEICKLGGQLRAVVKRDSPVAKLLR